MSRVKNLFRMQGYDASKDTGNGMRQKFLNIFALMLALIIAPTAYAEERIALIIGNGQYSAVSPLDNPINDANLMATSLEGLGFKVSLVTDATQNSLKRAISQFGRDLRDAGTDAVGLFYYAGHGVQSFGTNYLLPVDAELTDAADLDLVALEADSVLRQMRSAKNRTNIVILDACRDNPFVSIPELDDNGLAEMNAPTGTYLSYATAPGGVALDGNGTNSPFTLALAQEMQVEGAPIEEVFKRVRVSVLEQSGGAQTPWDTSSLTSDFVFKAGVVLTAEEVAEQQLWQSVEQSEDAVQVMLFLRTYPSGRFESEARSLLKTLMAGELTQKPKQEVEVVEAPKVVTPAASEAEMIEKARSSGVLADYEAYLEAFPQGVFAELAKLEMATIAAKAAPVEETQQAVVEPKSEPAVENGVGAVFYDQTIKVGASTIVGRTIPEIVALSPTFAPIEGLPDELWKGQSCANCHEWTREALCTQANTYLALSAERSLNKQHPFGGSFKQNLKSWATGGCQ